MADILNAIEVSAQGLSIQRRRLNAVAENLANAETTRTPEGGPYRRQRLIVKQDKTHGTFNSMLNEAGLRLTRTDPGHLKSQAETKTTRVDLPTVKAEVKQDKPDSYRLIYDPTHPDADAEGYVKMPDIDVVMEMVDMIAAQRAYEANTVAISSAKQMAKDALDI